MCARWDTSNLSRRRSMLSDLTVCIVLHPVVSFYIFVALQANLQATVHGRWKDTHPYETKCVDNGSNTGNHPSHRARQVEGQSSLRNIMFLCISSLFDMTSYRHCIPRLTRLTHANMLCGEYVVSCSGHRNQCVSSWVWQQTLLGAPGGIATQDKCKCMYVCACDRFSCVGMVMPFSFVGTFLHTMGLWLLLLCFARPVLSDLTVCMVCYINNIWGGWTTPLAQDLVAHSPAVVAGVQPKVHVSES